MNRSLAVSVLWATVLAGAGRVCGAEPPAAVANQGTAHEFKVKAQRGEPLAFTVYREMAVNGLTVKALPGKVGGTKRHNAFLRIAKPGACLFLDRPFTFPPGKPDRNRETAYPTVPELDGLPGLVTLLNKFQPLTLTFSVDKPARVYAYIRWDWTCREHPERARWHYWRIDPVAVAPVFYRDFPAGTHSLRFHGASFVGVGINALDSLSPQEKIVAVGRVVDDRPVVQIRSEHDAPQTLKLIYAARNPADGSIADRGELALQAKPRELTQATLPLKNLAEGVLYFVDVTLAGAGAQWSLVLPYGLFPVPPDEPSVQDPIFPYGGYIKLQVNEDAELYGRFLAATFYHFRKMHMNVALLASNNRYKLDLARKYRLRAIIRLGNIGGMVAYTPREVSHHPAVLTYAIGDEPKVGPKLDAHKKLFERLTKEYPQYKPITGTIYDSYGRGDETDPCRIYNEHLADFDLIRFGRLYCFQKVGYGLLAPVSYKCRIPATSVFMALEADEKRPWWLAPQFFGRDVPLPAAYWRVPSGKEMAALLHLAVAHRSTWIVGWGVHSHWGYMGLCFDGSTMAPTPRNAMKELGEFGAQLQKAKPILQAFTPRRVQLQRVRPWEVDAAARWLTDGGQPPDGGQPGTVPAPGKRPPLAPSGPIAVYLVNRDLETAHPVELHLFLGDKLAARGGRGHDPDALFASITRVTEVFTDAAVPFEKVSEAKGRFGYLKLRLQRLEPGQAALLVVDRKARAKDK